MSPSPGASSNTGTATMPGVPGGVTTPSTTPGGGSAAPGTSPSGGATEAPEDEQPCCCCCHRHHHYKGGEGDQGTPGTSESPDGGQSPGTDTTGPSQGK
jgi:hypothetical protein